MTTSLSGTIEAGFNIAFTNSNDFNDKLASYNAALAPSVAFANGTAANQANELFADERSLADAANEELDLSGGLTNVYGESLVLTGIKAIIIQNQSADASLIVGGAASNAWVGPFGAATHTITVPPGGFLVLVSPTAAGWAVTAGTGDLLKLTHDGTGSDALSYKIGIVGID